MESQRDLIQKREWDVLIILDACRYDYFEKIYTDYFEGGLKKVKSECLSDPFWKDLEGRTATWLKNTFTEKMKNLVYVSGTPHINSMGIDTSGKGFNPPEIFSTIVNAWDWGWDDELGTTPPEKMVEGAKMAKREYPGQDVIVHFLQPHGPYLGAGGSGGGSNVTTGSTDNSIDQFRKLGDRTLRSLLPEKKVSDLKKFFGLADYQRPSEKIAEKHGNQKLRALYENNLRSALEEARKIISIFSDSSIVISSDHGEFLGEEGLYGHHWDKKFLTEVPWLEAKEVL